MRKLNTKKTMAQDDVSHLRENDRYDIEENQSFGNVNRINSSNFNATSPLP